MLQSTFHYYSLSTVFLRSIRDAMSTTHLLPLVLLFLPRTLALHFQRFHLCGNLWEGAKPNNGHKFKWARTTLTKENQK